MASKCYKSYDVNRALAIELFNNHAAFIFANYSLESNVNVLLKKNRRFHSDDCTYGQSFCFTYSARGRQRNNYKKKILDQRFVFTI